MAILDISKTPLAKVFRKEGRAVEAREGILIQGRKKFGAPTAEVEAAIAAVSDLQRLHTLRDRLLDVTSWQEFLAE